jgi:hypothetical protein
MLKEKKLYLILLVLVVFALIGEQPKLEEDLRRTANAVMDLLKVNEVVYEWGPIVESLSQNVRRLLG